MADGEGQTSGATPTLEEDKLGRKVMRSGKGRQRDWLASPVVLAIASAVFGVLGTGLGAILQGYSNTSIERQKLEANLIIDALEPEDEHQRAKRLLFLVKSGLVAGLNEKNIAELAEDPSGLPRYGRSTEDTQSFLQFISEHPEISLLTTPLSQLPPDKWSQLAPLLRAHLEETIGRQLPADFVDRNKDLTIQQLTELALGSASR